VGVILDTSIWVDVERGRLAAHDVARLTGLDFVYLAPPVLAELEYGIHRAVTEAQKAKRAAAIARIRKKPCLIMDKDTGEIFGRLAASLDQEGRPAKHRTNDIWIAALALQHNMKIMTRNRSDFEDIPGITLMVV
jgi:tRNA(fMet)-specific endonuclease VapC